MSSDEPPDPYPFRYGFVPRRFPSRLRALGHAFEASREGIERKRAQQVAAQASFYLPETLRGALHPGEVDAFGQVLEFAQNVCVANQLSGAGLQEHQVFKQRVEGTEKGVDFRAAFGSGTVALGGLEQLAV